MLPLSSITKPSMISAEDNWILKDPLTLTWTDSLLKLSPHWLPHWDSMVPWTSILLNSKLTWSHIQEFTLCCPLTPQLSQPKKLITNNFPLLKSPTLLSNPPPWWLNVTQDTVNIWPALCYTEVMLSPKMSTPPLPPLKPREPSNSSTGAQPDSKLVSTINHQPLSQVVIWLKLWELSVWSPTLPPLPKFSPDWTTNSILCTPRELSSTGMSEKVWKKVNSQKPEKIWPP